MYLIIIIKIYEQNKGGCFNMVDTEVRVVNGQGEDVAQDGTEQGEIIVKGHGVLNDHIENSNKIINGWLRTGDQGTINKYGQINIIESNKDLTNNDGEKVSAFEIENVLSNHPAIREIAIIATPDINFGDILHAFVVLHDDYKLTEEELIIFSKKQLGLTNCPNKVSFMDELPKTASGKILKMQLGKSS